MKTNRVIYFVKRPLGMVTPASFTVREEALPVLRADETLVESLYASVDPYMRGRMSDRKSYTTPYPLNTPMQGGMVGRVIASQDTGLKAGQLVFGIWPWADYAAVARRSLRVLDADLPPTTALHVLGLTGLTAYIGLTQFGNPKPGEQLVVSAAAGAVGSLVGQIGRLLGLRAAGIAGSDEKCRWLTESLGFDAAFNYRDADFSRRLGEGLTSGVDVYFDNVGGEVSERVLSHLNAHARIVVSGQIAFYNEDRAVAGRPLLSDLLVNRAQAAGFIVGEHQELYPDALKQLNAWYRGGLLVAEETLSEGFDQLVDAFIGLFHGSNQGKAVVRLK